MCSTSCTSAHHYAFDSVPLLDKCIESLQLAIDADHKGRHDALYDLKSVLVTAEQLLHVHLRSILEEERRVGNDSAPILHKNSITETAADVQLLLQQNQRLLANRKKVTTDDSSSQHADTSNTELHGTYWNPQTLGGSSTMHSRYPLTNPARSATDTLLFRLIVALQLCLVRIGDAHQVVTGKRSAGQSSVNGSSTTDDTIAISGPNLLLASTLIISGCTGTALLAFNQTGQQWLRSTTSQRSATKMGGIAWKAGVFMALSRWSHVKFQKFWMTSKIVRSIHELEAWVEQWKSVLKVDGEDYSDAEEDVPAPRLDDTSRRLIEYAFRYNPKSYFFQSQGEIRFLMLKRFMDVYYASVGTAIDANTQTSSSWQLPLVAAAAASFYSITGTGATQKASETVDTASRDLIQHAWGMVSLPAIKSLMLQASRLVKGASVADRIVICGVPCFVVSKEPAPELAAALNRRRRQHQSTILSGMSTIEEQHETACSSPGRRRRDSSQFAGSSGRYRQRDVIFHLTGGGFFAHTIASDLPFLLDWSTATGSVIICPEYALLPEHRFPVALDQVAEVYRSLVGGEAIFDLGFEVNRIIVTGESTGGNLAASLCVKLAMETAKQEEECNESRVSDNDDAVSTDTIRENRPRMPDAMMLSCAILNLSLEMTLSRVLGTEDPVLPSGLISAISDAYLPPSTEYGKQHPLASPIYAPDAALSRFPPVLLFAGSNDPLLDDSVAFNERLRCLGVSSELRATHHVPHAYWGLGTAGFPEALEVQHQCQDWLARQLE